MTKDVNQQFKKIHNDSSSPSKGRDDDYFFSYHSSLGLFWCSRKDVTNNVTYQPDVPAGIHLGAGNATLSISQDQQLTANNNSTFVSYMIVPDGQTTDAETSLQKGRVISCGLFISWDKLESLPKALVGFIQRRATEPGLVTSDNMPKSVLEKLCSPITNQSDVDICQFIVESRANELVASVLSAFSLSKTAPRGSFKQVLQVRDLIDDNLREPLTQKMLAEKVGLNVRSLAAHFKEHIGMTINQYIAKSRMERGYQMLQQGLSVSQTAYFVGYSLPYFSEKFRQHFRISPSQVNTPSAKDH